LGEIEYENFNAASAKIRIKGINIHPGTAKNKMKNAALLAAEILAVADAELAQKLQARRAADTEKTLEKDRAVAARFNA
jgi:di/tripeptidase